jgi:hypothetical protein
MRIEPTTPITHRSLLRNVSTSCSISLPGITSRWVKLHADLREFVELFRSQKVEGALLVANALALFAFAGVTP